MSKLCCLYNENKFYESENMRGYNIIVVYNENADKILMCKRKKEPYKGLANFVGGKIEKNENLFCKFGKVINFVLSSLAYAFSSPHTFSPAFLPKIPDGLISSTTIRIP